MDPCSEMLASVMYPTAIFAPPLTDSPDASLDFGISALNPRNRLDSLQLPADLQWRIDDGDIDGIRFFAVPFFAIGKPPLRIDVYIPGHSLHPAALKETLSSHKALTVSGSRLAKLGICCLILQRLHLWSSSYDNFEAVYWSLPFGSRIIFGSICADLESIPVVIEPFYEIERQWLSVKKLQELWPNLEGRWPPLLDHSELQLKTQIHEAITLVTISSHSQPETFVFKSVSTDVKYFYHELKNLLTIEPHPHIIQRPLYVVTKQCAFGGKVGVCGFIHKYYPLGSLQRALEDDQGHLLSQAHDKIRIARQILSALIHIQRSPLEFYSDIKPNNILLSDHHGKAQVVMIDLEQRGAWRSWSPPEVHYIEFLEIVAHSKLVDEDTRRKYSKLMEQYIPGWSPPRRKARYTGSNQGYSQVWKALSPQRQEAAQVYMFGKLLWCLFEDIGFPSNYVTPETFREKISDLPFPEFRKSPALVRDCINQCTAGALERKGCYPRVVRVGDKLYRRLPGSSLADTECTFADVQAEARAWWRDEIRQGELYVAAWTGVLGEDGNGTDDAAELLKSIEERPSFQELDGKLATIHTAL
ncbi:hypothetical protein F5Y16DRAFT_225352 [Xylariaceae sp. FL0255]|nr:hypothetical protein F5Y16DRAFT_225352 [Xylariaceae sp. FL0255]